MADDEIKATGERQSLGPVRAVRWFWIKWVLATAVGGLVGGVVSGLVCGWVDVALGVFAGLVLGWAVIGTGEWLALRKRAPRFGWWTLATAVGGLVGGLAGGAVGELVGGTAGGFAGGAVGLAVSWAAVGAAQWLVLRKQVHRSGWWVLVTAVGGPVGLVGGAIVGAIGGLVLSLVADVIGLMRHSWVGWADLGALAWTMFAVLITSGTTALVVAGAITAFAMIELLRHPISEVQS